MQADPRYDGITDVVVPADKLALTAGTVKEVHGILGEADSLITAAPYNTQQPSASPTSKDAGDLNNRRKRRYSARVRFVVPER